MAEHSSQTSQAKKVALPSSIEQVMWSKRLAAVGGLVGLEVQTLYIGNNSEIQVELTDASGKSLGKYSERTAGNKFWAQIRVPADVRDELYATVKLPKHGLQKKSPPLKVVPPVQITNAKWDKSEVRRGDTLKLTADVKGVPDGVEALIHIFEHDESGANELVSTFTTPVGNKKIEAEWEFEYQDDTGNIPSAHEAEKGYQAPQYFFRVTVGEVGGESGPLEFKDGVSLELNDDAGKPIPGLEYILHCADGSQRKGKLDKEGKAFEKDVPPGPVTVEFVDQKK
ncbi:MAG: hypothetical protein H6Q30_953 [Bacteroidetes bacterium]|nr:hypothetical protein [Bacteroidota bacterium]